MFSALFPALKILKKTAAPLLCLAIAFAAAGCGSSRFGGDVSVPLPAPAPSAPLGQVSQSDLPPPEGLGASETAAAPAVLGEPSGAVDLTPAGIAGVWKADLGGMSCRLATPQTKAGQGYRAGAIHCPAALAQIGSWNINGKQLILYDKTGKNLATLYSVGGNNFSGQIAGGMPVSLSR